MKEIARVGVLIFSLVFLLWPGPTPVHSKWAGVDEAVVEKFAGEANRPAREPYINTDQGDLLLLIFLLAGAGGGFVGGYFFRELFPPKSTKRAKNA